MDKMERTGRVIRGIVSKLTGKSERISTQVQDTQKTHEGGLREGGVDVPATFDAMRQYVFDTVIKKGIDDHGDFTAYLVAALTEHPDALQTLCKTWTNRIIKTEGDVINRLAHSVTDAGIEFDESILSVFQLSAKVFVDDHWSGAIADDILGVMGNADDVISHYEHVFGRPRL